MARGVNEAAVEITVTLQRPEARAFAQFLKRAGYADYLGCASDQKEAHQMLYAGEKIREALAEADVGEP